MIRQEAGTKLCLKCGRPFEGAYTLLCDNCDSDHLAARERSCTKKAKRAGLILVKSRFVKLYALISRDSGIPYARELPLETIEDLLVPPVDCEAAQ